MATYVYPTFKDQIVQAGFGGSILGIELRIALCSAYTYSWTHTNVGDLTGIAAQSTTGIANVGTDNYGAVSGTAVNIIGDDVNFASVPGGGGAIDSVIIYKHADGTPANQTLVAYIDGFPAITPDGGPIDIIWAVENANSVMFRL